MGQDIATNTGREGKSGERPSVNTSSQLGQGQKTMGFYELGIEIEGVKRSIARSNHMRAWWKITGSYVV